MDIYIPSSMNPILLSTPLPTEGTVIMYNRKEDKLEVEVKGGNQVDREKLVYVIGHTLSENGLSHVETKLESPPYPRGISWSTVQRELQSQLQGKKIIVESVNTDDRSVKKIIDDGIYTSGITLALRDQLHKVNEVMKKNGKEKDLTIETDIVLYGFDLDNNVVNEETPAMS